MTLGNMYLFDGIYQANGACIGAYAMCPITIIARADALVNFARQ
ncbi:hypothetical protein BLKGLAD_06820 [Burkholderia gladioli pv. gladioli]